MQDEAPPTAAADATMAVAKDEGTPSSWQNFPNGLRVLVVDDDPLCLKVIEQMLKRCNYEVLTCGTAAAALEQLRDRSHNFDLVLSDVYMPDMDGFKLLEAIGLELDLPVIMMSSNGEHATVMRGVTHGACDFLIKPVRIEELRNIWQHVIRRNSRMLHSTDGEEGPDEPGGESRKRKDMRESMSERDDEGNSCKKPRVVWSVEMHQQFVQAVNQLGIDKAVPKKILELMNVEGLTRENVASHLQKYRLYLKRVQGGHGMPGTPAMLGNMRSGSKCMLGSHGSGQMLLDQQQQAAATAQQLLQANGMQLGGLQLPGVPATTTQSAGVIPQQQQQPPPQQTGSLQGLLAQQQQQQVPQTAGQPQQAQQQQQQQGGSSGQPPPPPQQQQQQQQVGTQQVLQQQQAAVQQQPSQQQQQQAGAVVTEAMAPVALMNASMMQQGMAGMGMNPLNAMMANLNANAMGMGGVGLPGLGLSLGQAGTPNPLLGMGPMGPMAMASGMGLAMPGMQGMAPGMPGMGLPGLANLPGMSALGPGMGGLSDPSALMSMMANFQAMLQAQAAQQGAAPGAMNGANCMPTHSSGGHSSGSVAHPGPATAVVTGPAPGGAAGEGSGVSAAGFNQHQLQQQLMGAGAAGGRGGGQQEGLGSVVMEASGESSAAAAAVTKGPDADDFSRMFDDQFAAVLGPLPGAQPGVAGAGGAGDASAGVEDFLEFFLKSG